MAAFILPPEGLVRRFAFVLLSALVATAASAVPSVLAAPPAPSSDEPAAVPGELLVGYHGGASPSARAEARGQAAAALVERVVAGGADRQEVELVELPGGASREAAIRRLENHPAVAYAEPNWILTTAATSDDPAYTGGSLWGMYGDGTSPKNAYGSQAGEAWAAGNTGSSSVVVGVIDTGVDISHPDLAANVWTNPGEIAGNRVDDDNNGYVDDVHGWDFYNGDATVYDSVDGDKHGTHVAGTIAGVGGNGRGVAGVAWSADVITAKFLGPNGGSTSNAVKAIDYMTNLKKLHGLALVATNNSWGGGGYSSSLYGAIDRADTAGVLFVAAAGNGGSDKVGDDNDVTPHYPSSYGNTNVIAVASIVKDGTRSGFSNDGSTSVDLGAPGSSIYSTLPGSTYGTYSGTSMATPHVTGAAVLAAATGLSGDEDIKAAILGSVVTTWSMNKTVTGGRLDVSGFVPKTAVVNSAPVAVNDSYTVTSGALLSVAAPGVVGNDTDVDGDTLAAAVLTGPTNGTLALEGDGSFTYTSETPFTGTDTFTYAASDGVAVSQATVSITVEAASDVISSTSSATIEWNYFGGKNNNNRLDIWVRVKDSSGNPVAGATVKATVNGTPRTATSDSSGVAMLATYRSVTSACFNVEVVEVASSPRWDGISDLRGDICKK